jgi:hypothetical protein
MILKDFAKINNEYYYISNYELIKHIILAKDIYNIRYHNDKIYYIDSNGKLLSKFNIDASGNYEFVYDTNVDTLISCHHSFSHDHVIHKKMNNIVCISNPGNLEDDSVSIINYEGLVIKTRG